MFNTNRILFEDNHLLVVNKLPGELVQKDKESELALEDELKKYLKEKYKKPGDAFLGVIHRLDRPTSGVVVFAKTSKALVRLNEDFKQRKINKIYWAVVKNKPAEEAGHLVHYLARDPKVNVTWVFSKEAKNRKRAELTYKLIANTDNYYLLEVELLTGRHHQIRAQLAAMGCPIKGDLKYGAERSNVDGGIHLHARKISFIHPVKKEVINLTAPTPKDVLWDIFCKQAGE